MKIMIRRLLIGGVLGGVIGAGVTYFVMVKKTAEIIEEYTFEEPDSCEKVVEEDRRNDTEPKEKTVSINKYRDIVKDEGYRDNNVEENIEQKDSTDDSIFMVSEEEFYNDPDDLEGETLVYYEKENLLVDENDEKVEDDYVKDLVGDNGLEVIKAMRDGSFLYVINKKLGTKYEVLKEASRDD